MYLNYLNIVLCSVMIIHLLNQPWYLLTSENTLPVRLCNTWQFALQSSQSNLFCCIVANTTTYFLSSIFRSFRMQTSGVVSIVSALLGILTCILITISCGGLKWVRMYPVSRGGLDSVWRGLWKTCRTEDGFSCGKFFDLYLMYSQTYSKQWIPWSIAHLSKSKFSRT